jgi:hypothetical protein
MELENQKKMAMQQLAEAKAAKQAKAQAKIDEMNHEWE